MGPVIQPCWRILCHAQESNPASPACKTSVLTAAPRKLVLCHNIRMIVPFTRLVLQRQCDKNWPIRYGAQLYRRMIESSDLHVFLMRENGCRDQDSCRRRMVTFASPLVEQSPCYLTHLKIAIYSFRLLRAIRAGIIKINNECNPVGYDKNVFS